MEVLSNHGQFSGCHSTNSTVSSDFKKTTAIRDTFFVAPKSCRETVIGSNLGLKNDEAPRRGIDRRHLPNSFREWDIELIIIHVGNVTLDDENGKKSYCISMVEHLFIASFGRCRMCPRCFFQTFDRMIKESRYL